MVSSWEQPLGGYYHYTPANSIEGAAYRGNYFNGLCLLNQMGSEYFQIKLIQPLVKDSVYKLCFYAKIGGTKTAFLHQVQSLDWHFPPKPYDVKGRARIKLQPEVRFALDTAMKYGEWKKFEQRYIAKGGESLLLIGKFFDRDDSVAKVIAVMNKRALLLRGTHKKEVKKGTDSINTYYKSIPEYNSKKKTQKQYAEFRKLLAKQTRETNDFRKMMNAKLGNKQLKLATEYDLQGYYYDIRFYFDEISIVPVYGISPIIPTSAPVGIPINLVSGQKFILKNILFESGKSILLPASSISLNRLVESLKKNPNLKLKISGHTDNTGNDLANQ